MNMVIKQTNKMKKMDITDSVENLCAEVQNQQNMKKLAMISRGELVVSEEFSKFLVEEYEHQNKAFEKFSAFLLINVQIDSIDENNPRSNNLHYLSVQPSQSSITSILSAILQEFFIQAIKFSVTKVQLEQTKASTIKIIQETVQLFMLN